MVLVGLAAAGLAAVAGNRAWVEWSGSRRGEGSLLVITGDDSATVPLAGALALVLLACWGVVLVSRGRVRRAVAVLASLVSAGMVLTAALGYGDAVDGVRDGLAAAGIEDLRVESVVWFWVFVACAVISLAATAAAVRLVPTWPEMGSRYDAPGAAPRAREETSLDLWRALDEGNDPTLADRRPTAGPPPASSPLD